MFIVDRNGVTVDEVNHVLGDDNDSNFDDNDSNFHDFRSNNSRKMTSFINFYQNNDRFGKQPIFFS